MFLNVKFFDGLVRISFEKFKLYLLHGTLIFDLLVLDVVAQGNQIFETGTLLL
jgi:hypothetical protein